MAFTGGIGVLRKQAEEWAAKVKNVVSLENLSPDLEVEKQKLISRAKSIKEKLEQIFGTIDELNNSGLQIGWFVPAAVIAAAAALITKWTFDYNKFMKKVNEYRRLQSQGLSPQQSANIVNTVYDQPLIKLNKVLPILLIGGGLFFYFRRQNRGSN